MTRRFGLAVVGALCLLPALTACDGDPSVSVSPGEPVAAASVIPDQYIVALNDADGGLLSIATDLVAQLGGQVLGSLPLIDAVVLRGDSAAAARWASNDAVAYVEPDQWMSIEATQVGPVWGLDRIDQRQRPVDGQFVYPDTAGAGTHLYIIDTGLRSSHAEFAGRVGGGRNFIASGAGGLALPVPLLGDLFGGLLGGLLGGGGGSSADPTDFEDCEGHGTHVAGTAAGQTYGVAKAATVYGVRVLDCSGSGPTSAVIAGIEWVVANHQTPAVANLSLGGGSSTALDDAVRAAVAAGVTMVVAAGNDNTNACNGSPNRVAEALVVGASDSADRRSSFSNTGTCVDLFAPGSGIVSAGISGDTSTANLSGTSMAAPHVAGAAALLLSDAALTPAAVEAALLSSATSNVLSNIGNGSPNLLLYVQP